MISTLRATTPQLVVFFAHRLAQLFVRGLAVRQQAREFGGAVHLAQAGLGDTLDSLTVVGDVDRRGFGVVDLPKYDGIDADRDRVAGQRLLGRNGGGLDAQIDDLCHAIDRGEHRMDARPLRLVEAPQSQDHRALPLGGDAQ